MNSIESYLPALPIFFKFVSLDSALKSKFGIDEKKLYVATRQKVFKNIHKVFYKPDGIDHYFDTKDLELYPIISPDGWDEKDKHGLEKITRLKETPTNVNVQNLAINSIVIFNNMRDAIGTQKDMAFVPKKQNGETNP
jgi:hypothetical protein